MRGAPTQITDRLATGQTTTSASPTTRVIGCAPPPRRSRHRADHDALGNLTNDVDSAPPEALVTGAFRAQEAHPRRWCKRARSPSPTTRPCEVGDRRLTWDAFDRLIATERTVRLRRIATG